MTEYLTGQELFQISLNSVLFCNLTFDLNLFLSSSEVARGQSPSDEKIQLCCKHKQEHSTTNDHGLRMNRSQQRNAHLKRLEIV